MKQTVSVVVLLAGLLLVVSGEASAQSSITGVVKDTSGAVLPGVTVEASSDALIEKVRSAVTDSQRALPYRRPSSRHLHGDVHAARVQHVQARRAGAGLRFHGDGQRRSAGRRARGDDHRHGRESDRRRPERPAPATLDSELVQSLPTARGYAGAGGADSVHGGERWRRQPTSSSARAWWSSAAAAAAATKDARRSTA